MKRTILSTALSLLLVTVFTSNAFSQFQGTIRFTRTVGTITTTYKYFVKKDRVRIEELDEDGKIQGVQLVNSTENTVVALSPERKLYMDAPNKRTPSTVEAKVEKTKETKEIAGQKCTKIIVSSEAEETEIAYWMADGEYEFFVPLLKTLNRKDKPATYYMQIEGVEKHFPMVGEENKKDGTFVSKLEVTEIKEGVLVDALFEVPAGYEKFERN
jgi:hypothetical protein